jgi:hypothetical protein
VDGVSGAEVHIETHQERQFFRALRELHRKTGQPSSRSLAAKIGGMSHTTIASALRGPKVPTWPVVVRLVEALDGDLESIRELWIEAREPLEIRTPADKSEVRVFISYARIDDQATYGHITKLVEDIVNAYRSMTGKTVGVFTDIESIKLGEDWRDRIRFGLSYSSIFLAFISPAYLRSAECRAELSEFLAFLEASSVDRLIIPLIYAKKERIEAAFAQDKLWTRVVSRLNFADISPLRSVSPGSPEWIETAEALAERIDEILTSFEPAATPEEGEKDKVVGEGKAPAPGDLERMAALEEKVPELDSDMTRIAVLMQDLTETVTKATPRFMKAKSFGERLAASKALAKKLDPIADEMLSTSDRLVTNFTEWNFLVQYLLKFAANGGNLRDPEVLPVLGGLWQLAQVGGSALAPINVFVQQVSQGIGASRDLDRPFNAIRAAGLKIAGLIGILDGWKQGLRTLETEYLGDGYLDGLPSYLGGPPAASDGRDLDA